MSEDVQVETWDEAADGPLTEASLREKLSRLGYAVTRYDYPPGTRFPPHAHGVDKIDAVLAGRFQIEMQDRRVVLGPGDWVRVPRRAEHSAEVIGDETVVSFDAVERGR